MLKGELVVISKVRGSVRRLLLFCGIGFGGLFIYGAHGQNPIALGIFSGLIFGLPAGIVTWLLLGIIRFAFGPVYRW